MTRAANLADQLEDPPPWLFDFARYLTPRHHASRACRTLTKLGRLLIDGAPAHPQALLERAPAVDPALARALEDFLTGQGLALALDHDETRAADRRRRRIEAVPETLRSAVAAFADHLVTGRERARRAGTKPHGHQTIESRLTTLRDFAAFLVTHAGKTDWAMVDVHDVEAFLQQRVARRPQDLASLRKFFVFATRRRLILIDPTQGLTAPQPFGFRGPTLTAERQRELFRRWTSGKNVHRHEAFVGLAALLHGATTTELRHLTDHDIDHAARSIRLGTRPHPTPLDPWTWAALEDCLAHRRTARSTNPHILITLQTKATRQPASDGYVKHTLDPVGLQPRILRSTRLIALATSIDPKLVAAAYGMTNDGVMAYLADRIDPTRLPEPVTVQASPRTH